MIERIREFFERIPPERRKLLLAVGVGFVVVVVAVRFLARRPGANQSLTAGAADLQGVNEAIQRLGDTLQTQPPVNVPTYQPPTTGPSSGPTSEPPTPVYYAPVATSTAASSYPPLAAALEAGIAGAKAATQPAPAAARFAGPTVAEAAAGQARRHRLAGPTIAQAAARAGADFMSLRRTRRSAPAPAPTPRARFSGPSIAQAASHQLAVQHLRAERDAARYGY